MQEDTETDRLATEPPRAAPPRELQLAPPSAAEFVICDHTIETFFSDQKSRGFHLHKSHLSDPKRLTRLLIAACLAYIWVVYLGTCALHNKWLKRLHRQDRCDLSLFRLGLRLLARCLKEAIPLPDGLLVPAALPQPPLRRWVKCAA